MREKKYYEWSFRTLDKYGDCYDLDFQDKLSGGLNDDEELELVLNFGNEKEGCTGKQYILVDHRNCKLPEWFDNNKGGYKVPKYLRKQFDKWVKDCNGDLGGISEKDEIKARITLNEQYILDKGWPFDDDYDPKSNPYKVKVIKEKSCKQVVLIK